MENIDGPHHQTHLETKDDWVSTGLREDKFDGIAVGDSCEALAPGVVAEGVNTKVAGETLFEIGVKAILEFSTFSRFECNREELRSLFGFEKFAGTTGYLVRHCVE